MISQGVGGMEKTVFTLVHAEVKNKDSQGNSKRTQTPLLQLREHCKGQPHSYTTATVKVLP